MDCLKEIQQFLTIKTPQHLKAIAITNVLSMLFKRKNKNIDFKI